MSVTFPEKLAFLFEPHRYKVLYGGRGGIKSWSVALHLLIAGAKQRLRIVKLMPQIKVEQGITAIRTIFAKCFFDSEKCADGIQALRHYRYEVDEAKSDQSGKHVSPSKVPRHDWASHAADAFRTAAVMIREPEKKKEQEKRRPGSRLSPWS